MLNFTAFICLLTPPPGDKQTERNLVPHIPACTQTRLAPNATLAARTQLSGSGVEQMENKAQLANLQLLWKASQLFLAISDVF